MCWLFYDGDVGQTVVINTPSQHRCGRRGSGGGEFRSMELEEIPRAYVAVMRGGVMFGKIIGQIISPASPMN